MTKFFRRYAGRIWLIAVPALMAAFVLRQRSDVNHFLDALAAAERHWLAVLVGAQAVVIGLTGLAYRVALHRVGHSLAWRRGVELHLERHVVGTITPLGGPASLYVYVRRLATFGIGTPDAVVALGIRSIGGYLAFAALLIPAFVFHSPGGLALIAFAGLSSVIMLLVAGGSLLLKGRQLPSRLGRLLPAGLHDFISRARAHRIDARSLAMPVSVGLAQNLASAVMLYVSLLAVGQDVPLTTAVVGYAVGNLFALVAPVFQGAGVVELTMAVALQQMGVPAPAAIAATLLFRLGDVWLPLLVGLTLQAARRAGALTAAVRRMQVRAGVPVAYASAAGMALALVALMTTPAMTGLMALITAIGAGEWPVTIVALVQERLPLVQIAMIGVVLAPIISW